MAFQNMIRAVFSGDVAPGDTWSVGLSIRIGTVPIPEANSAEMSAFAEDLGDAWVSNVWAASPGILADVAGATKFATVDTYEYGADGTIIAQGNNTRTPVAGTNTTNIHPAYTALCMSLLTEEVGRSYRGRMYLPTTGLVMSATLQCTTAAAQLCCDATAAFLSAVLGMTPTLGGAATPVAPIVWSSKLLAGSLITSVRADTIPDTQHGRENRLTPGAVVSAAVS